MTRIEGDMAQKGVGSKKNEFFFVIVSSETFIVACTFQNIKFLYFTTLLSKGSDSFVSNGRMNLDRRIERVWKKVTDSNAAHYAQGRTKKEHEKSKERLARVSTWLRTG